MGPSLAELGVDLSAEHIAHASACFVDPALRRRCVEDWHLGYWGKS
jgi:hypothetical protein